MIPGDNFTVDMDNQNLPVVKTKFHYPALYNGGLPAEFKQVLPPKERWYHRYYRLKTIKWNDFFKVQENKMVVYRIIPHASVANNNKRLWRAIHKMYEMYEGVGHRLERECFKFTYRQKDLFWYDVIFRQENGQKKIEFYVSTSEYQALKLKRKLENKMAVTIQGASIDNLQIPITNTIVQDIKYINHDIFSLNTNSQDTKTPIASILNTIDELVYDGDIARLSICNEVENRQKWVKSAQWAHEKLRKGKIPMRANAGAKRAVTGLKIGISGLVNEVNDLLSDTLQAFTNVFFKSDKEIKKEKVIPKAHGLEDEINSKRLSGASLEKINLPVFKSHIRVAAHSDDRLTRETIAETLALSLNELADNNELQGIVVKLNGRRVEVIEELNTLKLSKRTKLDTNVNLVSTDEMSKLSLQMPNQELQRKYADELSTKKQVEVNIPSAMTRDGIWLGVAEYKDLRINTYMPINNPDEFYRGYVFIGGQGAGKDTAIMNWVVQGNLKYGISFIIPDAIVEEGKRGMADGIRDALPPENVIDLNMNDDEYTPPMDLTEVIEKLGRYGASRFADEMIDFIDLEGKYQSEKYLTDAAKASRGSLSNIKRIIEDEEYRINCIQELILEGNTRLANELINWGTNEDLGSKCDPILSRLNRFFGNEKLYDIFAQGPLKELDFAKWMKERKVIIIRVPNGRGLGEHAVKTLVHWITLKAFMTRLLMTKEEQENGCFMVFNEPEQYQSEGLTKLMGRIGTEGRKERFGSIYAFHHWGKLQQSLQDNLQGGGVQQFLFMNDHTKTFDLSKHRFEDTIPLDQAYKLPAHHAIVSVRAGKELQPAFICHMAPPVKKKYDNSFLTKRHARIYGRKWEELQKLG